MATLVTDPVVTVITPAFEEAESLPLLYERLAAALAEVAWEWLVIDDHSGDETFARVSALAAQDPRVRGLRLARNSGSHHAAMCGIEHARGEVAVVMASDLQDPPESIPTLLDAWREGANVVWAVREERRGESLAKRGLSRAYHALMRSFVGLKELPSAGADFFLVDRLVMTALKSHRERHSSILMLITWLGFRQTRVSYRKAERVHGGSKWTLTKKLKLAVDSVVAFTYLPIRLISYFGLLVAALGFAYACYIIYNAYTGNPAPGWSSLMVVVLGLGGVQMIMMGVLGEYLWRALDEARARPAYTIEAVTPPPAEPDSGL